MLKLLGQWFQRGSVPWEGESVKLVVGLGNPGKKYAGTRHNVGFRVVEELHRRTGVGTPKTQFQGEVADARISGERVVLLSPTTFMNASGASVLAARDFYKLSLVDVLVVCDDFQLPLGVLRARPRGSAGGQKGLVDIIRRLGSDEVPRLRIGIGPLRPGWEASDFVLGRFERAELEEIEQIIQVAADAVEAWVVRGMGECMNEFNRIRDGKNRP